MGVHGFLDHLWTALDSTLQPDRLWTAALLGGGGGVTLALVGLADWLMSPWSVLLLVAAGLAFWLLQGWPWLETRLTFLELSQLRPATWREATTGLAGRVTRFLLAQLLLGLVIGGGLAALWLPATVTLSEELSWLLPILVGIGTVLRLFLETLLWLLLGLELLLAPVLVVEECGVWSALRQWWTLVRQHSRRVLLYKALTLGLAALVALPLLLVVAAAGWSVGNGNPMVSTATLTILGGLALTPALAFLFGANVYIYVNLHARWARASRH